MKVVHITYKDTGGAGIAVRRIHEGLIENGVKSKLLLLWDNTKQIKQSSAIHNAKNYGDKLKAFMYGKLLTILPKESRLFLRLNYYNSFYRIENHPLVKEADVIHLHWINKFINLPGFFKKVNKPIVWTFHDMTPFTGGFAYEGGEREQLEKMFHPLLELKKKLFSKRNITGVASTQEFYEKAMRYSLFDEKSVVKISLPIDIGVFKPTEKATARKRFKLLPGEKIVLFVAADVANKRKGLNFLMEQMAFYQAKNIKFAVIGKGLNKMEGVYELGQIDDPQNMALAYAAADLFVTPAVEEAFGQTTLEALCCGLPVVAFPTAGSRELIEDGINGFIEKRVNGEALRETIVNALAFDFNRCKIADKAGNTYNNREISERYKSLYASLLQTT